MTSGRLAVAGGHPTSTVGSMPLQCLCHMGLRGSTSLVPRPSCPLIPGAAPWCVSLPWPTFPRLHCPLPPSVRQCCCVLDQEERLCPLQWACPSVRASRAGYGAYTATPRGVKVRVPRPSPMCSAGVLSPTSSPPGPRGRSPHQNFGEGCCVPRGWSVGDPSASPWEERITRPRVVALPLLHLLEFCCHCPSPHACTPGALCSLGIPRWRSRKESAC